MPSANPPVKKLLCVNIIPYRRQETRRKRTCPDQPAAVQVRGVGRCRGTALRALARCDLHNKRKDTHKGCLFVCGAGKRSRTSMKLLSHGPEPCASANSAIPAEQYIYYDMPERKASTFLENVKDFSHLSHVVKTPDLSMNDPRRNKVPSGDVSFVYGPIFGLQALYKTASAFKQVLLSYSTAALQRQPGWIRRSRSAHTGRPHLRFLPAMC